MQKTETGSVALIATLKGVNNNNNNNSIQVFIIYVPNQQLQE
jgi:hypothetical protein